jgi:hypothetical protein
MEFEDKNATLEKINIILRQTDYEESVAREKLIENGGDHVKVIKNYLGIQEKIEKKPTSVNQEIYRQLRIKMNDSMLNYNKKQKEKLAQEIEMNNKDSE